MQHYLDTDLKLRRFVPIIQKSAVYPVVFDARRTVLSLPPIINSAHSAVSPPALAPCMTNHLHGFLAPCSGCLPGAMLRHSAQACMLACMVRCAMLGCIAAAALRPGGAWHAAVSP